MVHSRKLLSLQHRPAKVNGLEIELLQIALRTLLQEGAVKADGFDRRLQMGKVGRHLDEKSVRGLEVVFVQEMHRGVEQSDVVQLEEVDLLELKLVQLRSCSDSRDIWEVYGEFVH